MVRCPRCGYDNGPTDIYCRNCTYPLQDPHTYNGPKRNRNKKWGIGTGKKILIVIGVVVIGFLLFSMVYNLTQPSLQSSLNVVTDENPSDDSPYNPFQVNISYDGSWSGEAGEINHPSSISGSGSKIIRLDCASWDNITVSIKKEDASSAPLKVQLLRNGNVILEKTTTKPHGSVELSV